MSKNKQPCNFLELLEELRSIAQLGLHYSKDPYDHERYERLLELVSLEYSKLFEIKPAQIGERFKQEIGYVTPKVGVDAAIFNSSGHIVLIERSDDKSWCLPCGWAELNETPQESIRREVEEETHLIVEVKDLIDVFVRLPGQYDQPHTSYFLLFHCIPKKGSLSVSDEARKVGYFDHTTIKKWHRDHRQRADKAYDFYLKNIK